MDVFYSKSKLLKFSGLNLLGLAAAVLVYIVYPNISGLIFGIIGSLLFGTMSIVVFFRIFNHKPQVILNLEGIEDTRLNTDLIKWDEIKFITLEENKRSKWLNLNLYEPDKVFHKLPSFQKILRKANGQTERNNFRIRFIDLDTPIEEVWNFIENNVIKPRNEKGIHLMP